MKPTSEQILGVLAERARSFDFPALDSANVTLLAARVRCFSRNDDWAIVFEWLGFSEAELAFPIDIYAYGSLLGAQAFAIRQAEGVAIDPDSWTAVSEWDPGGSIAVRLGAERIEVGTGIRNENALKLSHGDLEDEVAFGRALVREIGLARLLPDDALFAALPQLRDAVESARLSDWDHPDVAGGQSPKQSKAMVACARFLAGESSEVEYDHTADVVRLAGLAVKRTGH